MPDKTINTVFLLCTSVLKLLLHIGDSERKQIDRLAESKRVYERNVYVVKLTPACYQGFTVPIISFTDLMPLLSRNSFISSIIFTGA